MEQKIYDQIKNTSHPKYNLDRAVMMYELYTTGQKTARDIAYENGIAMKNFYSQINGLKKKVARARRVVNK